MIDQMKTHMSETLGFSREILEESDHVGGITCLMDNLNECENELLEKDRVSLALLGRNGAGKSFLINILLLLTSPSSSNYGSPTDRLL